MMLIKNGQFCSIKKTMTISTGTSSQKIKPFDFNLEPTKSNLANGRAILKLNNSALLQKSSSPLYSNFILNLHIVDKLNNRPRNPFNNFPLENCLFSTVKLVKNAIKSKFTYNGQGRALN